KKHIFDYIEKLPTDETLSLKKLRQHLETKHGVNLEDKKKLIKKFVDEYATEKDEEDELLPKKKEETPTKKRKQEAKEESPKKRRLTTPAEERPPADSSGVPEYITVYCVVCKC